MNLPPIALIAVTLLPFVARAQSPDTKSSDCSKLMNSKEQYDCDSAHAQIKTIYLTNVTTSEDAKEILDAARNLLSPGLKIYLDFDQKAIVVNTYPEEIARAEGIIHSLDRPRKTFRLTYTITELDAGKTIGTEHLSMVVVDGDHGTVKQGDKVPVATGSFTAENSAQTTQFTYLDVGMNIDATLTAIEAGALLKGKVEQSSIGQTSTIAGVTEPIVRQTVIECYTFLPLGKPVLIGSIDVPNTTHRYDIAVVMDPIK